MNVKDIMGYDYTVVASVKSGNSIWGFILREVNTGWIKVLDKFEVHDLIYNGNKIDAIKLDDKGNLYPVSPISKGKAARLYDRNIKTMKDFVNHDYTFRYDTLAWVKKHPLNNIMAGTVAGIMPGECNDPIIMLAIYAIGDRDVKVLKHTVVETREQYADSANLRCAKLYGQFAVVAILNMKSSEFNWFSRCLHKYEYGVHWNLNSFSNMEERTKFIIQGTPFGNVVADRMVKDMGFQFRQVRKIMEEQNRDIDRYYNISSCNKYSEQWNRKRNIVKEG